MGKLKTPFWKDAAAHYLTRINRWRPLEYTEVRDGDAALRDCLAQMIADTELREKIARHNAENLPPQNWDMIAEATLAEYGRARCAQGL